MRITIFYLLMFSGIIFGNKYYVSTAGDDDSSGTITQPFRTITKLLSVIQPGDTGIIREGTYELHFATQRSGTQQNPIVIKAFDGEHPVLVGTGRTSNGGRFKIKHNWYIIENLELKNGSAGFTFTHNASHNILRNCTAHYHYYTGIYLADGAAYNKIINCDAYDMYDTRTDGGSGDGFSVSGQDYTPGPGNVFIGCRAWHNSDDGFDVWKAGYPVEFINCYSFRNGTNKGDGNGFKLGINKTNRDKHILKNCVAWKNRQNGFDYNENTLPQTLLNCTAYANYRNYKFSNLRGAPETDNIQNCISVKTTSFDVILKSIRDSNTNSWNLISPNAQNILEDNFISTDDFVISGKRNSDGSIPENDFLRLKDGSIFVDAGVDVGLPFKGKAPDLGAFESDFTVDVERLVSTSNSGNNFKLSSYPSPAKEYAVINYHLPSGVSNAELIVFNILGQSVKKFNIYKASGYVNLSTTNLPSGTYIYVIQTANKISKVKKILVVK